MSAEAANTRDDRRARLLQAALTVFSERGYHDASIAEIIERASVARGTFYNYFRSKRAIFEVLLDGLFAAVNDSVSPIAVGHPAAVQRQLGENVEALVQTLVDNLPMARILLVQAVGLDPEANHQLRAFYTRVLDRLESALRAGQSMGIIRAGDTAAMALCTLGLVKESLFQQILGTRAVATQVIVSEILATAASGILAQSQGALGRTSG